MDSVSSFDPRRFYLGRLCKRGHDWDKASHSIRYRSDRTCMLCNKEKAQAREPYKSHLKWIVRVAITNAIKLERGCADCGYNAHPAALHFDHLPETVKTDIVSRVASYHSRVALFEEIAKCEVVCANCHAVRTAERRKRTRQGTL